MNTENKETEKQCDIHVFSKSFYCAGVKKTTKKERNKINSYEYQKWLEKQ